MASNDKVDRKVEVKHRINKYMEVMGNNQS